MAEVGDYDSGLKYSGFSYSTIQELVNYTENFLPPLSFLCSPATSPLSFREWNRRISGIN